MSEVCQNITYLYSSLDPVIWKDEGDDCAVGDWESEDTDISGITPFTDYSILQNESKENIMHNLIERNENSYHIMSSPPPKRLKALGNSQETEIQKHHWKGRRIYEQEESPSFHYTQWVEQQLKECQQLQEESYLGDSLPLNEYIAHCTSKETGPRVERAQEPLPDHDLAESLGSQLKQNLTEQIHTRCKVQSEHNRKVAKSTSPKGKSTLKEGSLETCCPNECTQDSESKFHFSEWVRNQLSECARLQCETNSPESHSTCMG